MHPNEYLVLIRGPTGSFEKRATLIMSFVIIMRSNFS